MNAKEIIAALNLAPHPEGGHYAEVFRAELTLETPFHDGARSASTAIYFLLQSGEFSAFHRVRSDEGWHHYAGDALELTLLTERGAETRVLGADIAGGERPFAMVPRGVWQAARPRSGARGYALVGCTVAPGFDFRDFEMPPRAALIAALPQHRDLIIPLTRA